MECQPLDQVLQQIFPYIAPSIKQVLLGLNPFLTRKIEEIRLRVEKPLAIWAESREILVNVHGVSVNTPSESYVVNKQDVLRTLELLTQGSLYAWEQELKYGYITIAGGHRVGLSGEVITERGLVKALKYITGLNIRLAREVKGCSAHIIPFLYSRLVGRFYHSLLVSPPRCGKTTILRDLIRTISNGMPELGIPGVNVGLVDERSEVAGSYFGVPQKDVGLRTDVLDRCPKAQGMMMMVRSMSPQVIATDEIGSAEDVEAIAEVMNAGTTLIATAHGSSIHELERRPALGSLLEHGAFERIVILSRAAGPGTLEEIIDGISRRPIYRRINRDVRGVNTFGH